MAQEVIEIGLTVPYEIEINSDDINMDNFECFFSIETDYTHFNIPLKKKGKDYILKVPQELSFIGNSELDYKIYVTQENAIFVASEGKVKVISASKDSFKVKFKAQTTEEPEEKKPEPTKKPETTPQATKKPTATQKPAQKESVQSVLPPSPTPKPVSNQTPEQIASGEEIKRESLKEYKRENVKAVKKGTGAGRSLQEIMEEKAQQKEKLKRKDEINNRVKQLLGEMKS